MHPRNLHDAGAAKGVERVVGELALADVAANLPGQIVGREAHETHLLRLDQADNRSECVLLADRARDDFLKIHFERAEEMLGQIGAMEANRFIGIATVVVVPVEQCRWRARGQLHCVHSKHAGDIHFAGAGEQMLAHHAHYRARHHAEILFERSPALDGTDLYFRRRHPLVDDRAQLRHLHERRGRHVLCVNIFLDGGVPSESFIRSMRPSTSDKSSVSMEIPFASRIFSL